MSTRLAPAPAAVAEPLEPRMFLSAAAAAPHGGADPSFADGGRATFSVPVSTDDVASAIAVGGDGTVLVGGASAAGSYDYDGVGGGDTTFAAFGPDGSPDPAF